MSTKEESQTGSEIVLENDDTRSPSKVVLSTDISSIKTKKIKKTSDFVAELTYKASRENTFQFLSKKVEPSVEQPISLRRPPLLEPSDLFTVNLKKSPASASIRVNGTTLNETARKQLRFNRCATRISQIYPYLFISGDIMAKNLEKLKEKNIKYILNLAPSVCKNYFEEKDYFHYKNVNLLDSTSENDLLWAFLKSIDFIETASNLQPCFVHCHQGVSRSGAIVVAFVMYKDKLSFREAFEVVKAKHEVCSPNSAFIAQLIKFEKRLGFSETSDEFEEEVFLVTRHSQRDTSLVIKPIDVRKLTKNVDSYNIYNVLDSRGTFIVYKSSSQLHSFSKYFSQQFDLFSGIFFVCQGQEVSNKASYKQAALEYLNLLTKYIPLYQHAQVVFVGSKGQLLSFENNDGFNFFTLLGKDENNFKSFEHMDVFFAQAENSVKDRESLNEVLKTIPKNEYLAVKLFHCKIEDGLHSFESVEQFDSEDLTSTGAYILEAFNEQEKIIKYYIWLGKDVETLMNEQAVIELCTDYISSDLKVVFMKSGENVIDQGTELEREGQESKDFLVAFDSGL